MSSSASSFSVRLQGGERHPARPAEPSRTRDAIRKQSPDLSLSAAQRATLTCIAGKRDGVRHCELPATDLVTLLRSYLVRFSTPDMVEATARGRQVLEADSPAAD